MSPPVSCSLRRGDTLVFATHNPDKVREIDELVAPFGLTVASGAALGSARAGRDRHDVRGERHPEGGRRGERVRSPGAGG